MPQTSVTTQAEGFPGLLVDLRDRNIESKVSEEASAEIPFGVMVKRGTAREQVKLMTAITNLCAGIVVHQQYARDIEVGTTGIKPKVSIGALQQGCIWVYSEEAVTPALAVRVRAIAAGAEIAGSFRVTADANDCIDLSKLARWRNVTTGAGIAQLEIDMNNIALAVPDA